MKNLKNILIVSAGMVAITLSSCMKEFNAKSYAPPLSINGFTSSSQVAKSSQVAYWSFDNTITDSVASLQGVNTGTSFAALGIKKQALQGALNSYVEYNTPSSIANLQSFTISFWVNTPPPTVGIIGVFAISDTTGFWGNAEMFFENGSTNDNGILKVHLQQGDHDGFFVTSGLQNLFGKWIAVTLSYDAATGTNVLYINGSQVNTAVLNGITGPIGFANVGKLVLGCDQFQTNPSLTSATQYPGFASFLTGQLDEFRIYNKALSSIEVSSLVALQGRGK